MVANRVNFTQVFGFSKEGPPAAGMHPRDWGGALDVGAAKLGSGDWIL